jgi:hypothetical protein
LTDVGPAPDEAPLSARISRADRRELVELVSRDLPRFTERDVLQILRHPYCSESVIVEVLSSGPLASVRAIRRAVALHPATPRASALACLGDLPWRDLADIGRDLRVSTPVRRVADQNLLVKIPGLSLGEKIALARLADRELISTLLQESDPAVFAAVLANPRLTSELLLTWLVRANPEPAHLARLSRETRWRSHSEVRGALFRNPRTPRGAALGLLSGGTRAEWRRLMWEPGIDPLIAACARRLLSGRAPGGVDRGGRHR